MLNSDWLSDSIMNGDWLYFSHVKNAIRKPDWTYRFFHWLKYSAYRIYLQGLLPKILAIYTINIDYFMVGERARFLFTSCEVSQTNERVFERVSLRFFTTCE